MTHLDEAALTAIEEALIGCGFKEVIEIPGVIVARKTVTRCIAQGLEAAWSARPAREPSPNAEALIAALAAEGWNNEGIAEIVRRHYPCEALVSHETASNPVVSQNTQNSDDKAAHEVAGDVVVFLKDLVAMVDDEGRWKPGRVMSCATIKRRAEAALTATPKPMGEERAKQIMFEAIEGAVDLEPGAVQYAVDLAYHHLTQHATITERTE